MLMASEESAIRTICPDPEKVWAPKAGEPVIAELYPAAVIERHRVKRKNVDFNRVGER